MKKKNSVEPTLMERSNDEQLAQSKPRDVTPMLATNVAGIIKETTSREAEIREWAFSLYEQRGRREGHQLED